MKRKILPIAVVVALSLCWAGFKVDKHHFLVSKNLDVFNSIFKELDMFYVDTINPQEVIQAGIDAMLDEIDPYTAYYPEEDLGELKQMTTGKYAGIGSIIRLYKARNRVVIYEPYEGTPAAEAGLKVGDIILTIDGKDVEGLTTDKVSDMLRGEAGTTFVLKVERPGEEYPLEFKITRRNIQMPAVSYSGMLPDGYTGYLQLTSFTEKCSRDVRRAVIALKEQGMTGMVLDLRGNGGGLLSEAVEIVNLFVPKGLEIVSTKGKLRQACHVYKTSKEPLDLEIPLVVLVDGATASAAEIVSGALQDLDRAVVVGARTFGKGLVQIPRDLPYNGQLKVTTSRYYIPSGRCIQAIDYQHRDKEGRAGRIPDSLTTVFHTAAGRKVRDGGGIRPDVEVKQEKLSNLLFYLLNDDVLLDYGTDYARAHETIAGPEYFVITDEDYAAFKQKVLSSDFKYDRQSVDALEKLKEIAEFEGYLEDAKPEFEALEKKLQHNLEADLDRMADEIKPLIAAEIVKRYYFQRGVIALELKDDPDLEEALRVLEDNARYASILSVTSAESDR
ncbi:MAG: S41 family peptidase [Bacteroidaceae bacterium]|nr:S41 family peptidase [Bacteroidaceae bacterium]